MLDQTLSDQQLDHLIATGLVTHFLVLPATGFAFSIDPKMVSGVPGITLTVVLDDGRVAIGCPAAVPDVISEMAVPITAAKGGFPQPEVPSEIGPDVAVAGVLQEIMQTLRNMTHNAPPDPDLVAQSLNRIEGQVTTLRAQAGAADAVLSGLDDRLDRMAGAMRSDQIAPPSDPGHPLTHMQDVGTAIEARLAQIEAAQAALVAGLTELPRRGNAALDALSSKVDEVAVGTHETAQTLRGLANVQLQEWLAAVPEQLTQMTIAQDQTAEIANGKLSQMSSLLTDMVRRTDPSLQPIDTIGMSDVLDTLQADQAALRHIAKAHTGALDGVRLGVAELMAGQLKQSAISDAASIRSG